MGEKNVKNVNTRFLKGDFLATVYRKSAVYEAPRVNLSFANLCSLVEISGTWKSS